MRSEKREEKRKLEQEAREAKRKERKRGLNRVTAFFSLVYIILAVVFTLKLYGLGMLPNLYFAIICAVLLLTTILIVPSMLKGKAKAGRKIVSLIVSIAMIVVFCGGIVYMNGTMDFFNKVTEEPIPTEDYYVISQADNIKESVNELEGTTVGSALMTDANYSEAKAILSKIVNVEFTYDESFDILLEKVLSREYESALVSAAYFDTKNTEEHPEIQEGIKILYEIEIPLEVATSTEAVDVTSEGFNIFISGTDNDGIAFLNGQNVSFVNKMAQQGTLSAHSDVGNVPNIEIHLKDNSAYSFGYMIYFFMLACGMSCYLAEVNPFNQPGVEVYKKKMFKLLGKE